MAPQAQVSASSERIATGQLAVKAVDLSLDGWPGDYTREWATLGEGAGAWISLLWTTPRVLESIVLADRRNSDDRVTGGTLIFSDGSEARVGSLPNDGSPLTVSFSPKTVTSVRFVVTSVSSTTSNVGLAEIEALA